MKYAVIQTKAPCGCPLVFPQASGPWTAHFQSMSKFIRWDWQWTLQITWPWPCFQGEPPTGSTFDQSRTYNEMETATELFFCNKLVKKSVPWSLIGFWDVLLKVSLQERGLSRQSQRRHLDITWKNADLCYQMKKHNLSTKQEGLWLRKGNTLLTHM